MSDLYTTHFHFLSSSKRVRVVWARAITITANEEKKRWNRENETLNEKHSKNRWRRMHSQFTNDLTEGTLTNPLTQDVQEIPVCNFHHSASRAFVNWVLSFAVACAREGARPLATLFEPHFFSDIHCVRQHTAYLFFLFIPLCGSYQISWKISHRLLFSVHLMCNLYEKQKILYRNALKTGKKNREMRLIWFVNRLFLSLVSRNKSFD